jgi:hypothetical protein
MKKYPVFARAKWSTIRFRAIQSILAAGCLALPAFPLAAQDARQQIALSGPTFAGSWQFFGTGTAASLPAYGSSGYNSGPFQNVYVPHVFQTPSNPPRFRRAGTSSITRCRATWRANTSTWFLRVQPPSLMFM